MLFLGQSLQMVTPWQLPRKHPKWQGNEATASFGLAGRGARRDHGGVRGDARVLRVGQRVLQPLARGCKELASELGYLPLPGRGEG